MDRNFLVVDASAYQTNARIIDAVFSLDAEQVGVAVLAGARQGWARPGKPRHGSRGWVRCGSSWYGAASYGEERLGSIGMVSIGMARHGTFGRVAVWQGRKGETKKDL